MAEKDTSVKVSVEVKRGGYMGDVLASTEVEQSVGTPDLTSEGEIDELVSRIENEMGQVQGRIVREIEARANLERVRADG